MTPQPGSWLVPADQTCSNRSRNCQDTETTDISAVLSSLFYDTIVLEAGLAWWGCWIERLPVPKGFWILWLDYQGLGHGLWSLLPSLGSVFPVLSWFWGKSFLWTEHRKFLASITLRDSRGNALLRGLFWKPQNWCLLDYLSISSQPSSRDRICSEVGREAPQRTFLTLWFSFALVLKQGLTQSPSLAWNSECNWPQTCSGLLPQPLVITDVNHASGL